MPSSALKLVTLHVNFFFFLGGVTMFNGVFADSVNEPEFLNALNQIFVYEHGAGPVSSSSYHVKLIKDLFYRQNIPLDISKLKNSSDSQIYQWLVLASLTGINSWKRDEFNKIILSNLALPIEPKKISNAEGDIFLCLVFSLLIYIAAVQFYQIMDEDHVSSSPATSMVSSAKSTLQNELQSKK